MGIGSLLQLIAVISVIVGVFGIFRIVTALAQRRPFRIWLLVAVAGFLVGILLFVFTAGLLEIGVNQTAVVYNTATGQLGNPRAPGISFVTPGIEQVTMYRIDEQEYSTSGLEDSRGVDPDPAIEARSIDGQTVKLDATIYFRIPTANVNRIHQDWSTNEDRYMTFIRSVVRSVVRDGVSNFQAEEIYGAKREDLQDAIERDLNTRLTARGFELSDVLLLNITFSPDFTQAIEDKQIEQQRLQQAQTAAQRREEEARGTANATIENARGDAEARLVQARAEAEALSLISAQLAANPNLLQYIYIQNLADDIKLALIPSNSPFLFDSSTFTDLAPDFAPPAIPTAVPTSDGE